MQYPDAEHLQICRQLRHLVDTSIELRVRIELGADGFLLLGDRGADGLPATELLELVLDRRRAFEELLPRSHWSLPFPVTEDKKFEVGPFLVWPMDACRGIVNDPSGCFALGGRWRVGLQSRQFIRWYIPESQIRGDDAAHYGGRSMGGQ